MKGFQREYREFLRGLICGLNYSGSIKEGSLSIGFLDLDSTGDLNEVVRDSLNGWNREDIPYLKENEKGDFLANLRAIIRRSLPRCDTNMVAENIYRVFKDEFGSFTVFGKLFELDEDSIYLFILISNNERVLVKFSLGFE